MPNDDDIRRQTLELIQSYQTLLVQGRWDDWTDLWADDGELEFPFAPKGRQSVFRGKAAIRQYMEAAAGTIAIDQIAQLDVRPALNPRVATVEIAIKGHLTSNGNPYDQRYVLVFETENGKLKRYREYWNPLVSIEAYGGLDPWLAKYGGRPIEGM